MQFSSSSIKKPSKQLQVPPSITPLGSLHSKHSVIDEQFMHVKSQAEHEIEESPKKPKSQ
jgi:hypothetical protein